MPEASATAAVDAGPTDVSIASDGACLRALLPPSVLKGLFDRIDVSVEPGALENACSQQQKRLREAAPTDRFRAILRGLELQGVQAVQLRWARFDLRQLPALLFHDDRWQLVERVQGSTLRLTDGADASHECSEDSLGDGIVLWVRKAPGRDHGTGASFSENRAARMVWGELFRDRRWLREVALATVMINLLAVATSVFAMQVYDRVVPTFAYVTLWTLVAGMGLVLTLDWGLKTLRARILDSTSCAVDRAVSQRVFDHVMRLQLDSRPRSLGTLAAQVGGLDAVRQFFSSGVVFALIDMPFALMFIAFIAFVGGNVAWVYVAMLPVAVALGLATQRRLRSVMHEQMMRANERQGMLVDAIRGAESVRASNATWRFSDHWAEITASIGRHQLQQRAVSNRATFTTGALASMAYVSALVVGVGEIEAGKITMGALIACSILGGRVIAPASQSMQYLSQWQNVSQSLDMVNQLLMLATERRPDQNLLMPDEVPDRVELEGVRFSYPGSPVRQLDVPTLNLRAGDRVALLGTVGSGKSTLLKILAGLYRPSEGRVRLGNADLWEIDPDLVSQHVSYLPQNVHLFRGTLRSNLALSGVVGDSHLLEIARELGIDRIAGDSPLHFEREISEGGEGLSGGQRQLVGLGRVFLARPKIWLLDEPTAALDVESERGVLAAIKAHVRPDDILVVATHRPGLAMQLADRVLWMRQGEVAADGPSAELIPKLMGDRPASGARRPSPAPRARPANQGGAITHV